MHVSFSSLNEMKPMGKQIQLHVSAHRCWILTDVLTCKQSVVQCFSPVSFENNIPFRQMFDHCQRFQVSDQISDIYQIHPIEISTDDIFKILCHALGSFFLSR